MELEFYQELFLTAVISLLFAFLLRKISGGGRGDGERHQDALASSYVFNSGKELRRHADEGVIAVADGSGTGERFRGPEREIVEVEEHASVIELVLESVKEKKTATDILREGKEKISEKMAEPADIDRYSADDLVDEVDKEVAEESEADWSCSGFKIELNQETEIASGSGEGVCDENKGESLLIGEDDWECIERSELEKRFGVASEYSASPSGSEALARRSSDVQMDLYGLHKIATEGPCYESQPLSLEASARWHAWQKLGEMTPEVAMEQYINLLSKSIPGWVVENYREDAKVNRVADIQEKGILNTTDLGSSLQIQLNPAVQMKSEDQDSDEIDSATGGLKVLGKGLTGTFLLNLLFPTRGAFS